MATNTWHPSWWDPSHMTTWERVKAALQRDWEQTKHDLGIKGAHYLNQDISDTVRQASGTETIPGPAQTNPPKELGSWDDVELPIGYGYVARDRPGAAGSWTNDVEASLRAEWEQGPSPPHQQWDDVRPYVRRGYEYPRTSQG